MSICGRTFYVDSIRGCDSNEGTCPDKAWRTIDKVNAQNLRPGDEVLFCRGCEWNGMLVPKGDGEEFSPIVIGAYGEGERPLIKGEGAYAGVFLDGVSHYRVQDLAVTNHAEERDIRQGICIRGAIQGISGDIEINGCEVYDVTGDFRRSMGPYKAMYWNGGIYVTYPGRTSDENHLHRIVISNNFIHDVNTSGIRINQGEDGQTDLHHTAITVRGNRIERTGSDGIIVANSISPLIIGNVCSDAGALGNPEDTVVIAGVWCCAVSDPVFERNVVLRTRLFKNDGTAFDTDWGCRGTVTFRYNVSYDNGGGFWLDCSDFNMIDNKLQNVLKGNISINDRRCLVQYDRGMNTTMYGNLFYNVEDDVEMCNQGSGDSHKYVNNIFVEKNLVEPTAQLLEGGENRFYTSAEEVEGIDIAGLLEVLNNCDGSYPDVHKYLEQLRNVLFYVR